MKFKALTKLDDVKRLAEFLLDLKSPYSLDLETTGTDPWRNQIVGAGFCWDARGALYVPFRHEYDQPFDGDKALGILAPVFEQKPFVGFNAIFEIDFLELSEKLTVHAPCVDVSLLAYVAGRYPAMSLKVIAQMECPQVEVKSYKEFMDSQSLSTNKNHIGQAPISAVSDYCGRDTLAAFIIYTKLYEAIKNHRIYKLERAVFPVTKEMRRNGVLIDKAYFEEEKKRLVQYLDTLQKLIEAQVSERAGKPIQFNIGSSKQLGEVLFDILKLPCSDYTPKGARRTGKEILHTFKWKEPIVRNIIAWKEIDKRKSTYYDTYVRFAQNDGRIHASYNQSGVPSGRYSCSDPNLQNLPKKETWKIYAPQSEFPELFAEPRMGYIVPDDCWILEWDFSQIEARIAAGATQERILLDAFKNNIDFHTKTASLVFRVPVENVSQKQRFLGKTLNFTLIYGAGIGQLFNTLQEEMDVSYEQATRLHEMYHKSYRQMFYGAEMIAKEAQSRGCVTTLLGRRVPIFLFQEAESSGQWRNKKLAEAQRMAYNQLVQGTAADIVKVGMVKSFRLRKEKFSLDKVKLIMMTHDSLAFEVHNSVQLVSLIDQMNETLYYKLDGCPDCFVNVSMGRRLGALTEKKDTETTAEFVARVTGGQSELSVEKEKVAPETTGERFVLELPDGGAKRTQKHIEMLKEVFTSNPGNNTIIVRVGEVQAELPYKTSISLKDRSKILLLVGGNFTKEKNA